MLKRIHSLANNRCIDIGAIILFVLFTAAGILVSLNRFWQLEVFYIDFGVYDELIWKIAHFQKPFIDHFVLGHIIIFADHFPPSILLLSPFYWFTQRSEMILVIQALAVGLSGIVLYRIGNTILKNKLASFSILVCYFLFVGLQNAVITEFHEITVMTLPFMLTFWAFARKKVWLYFLFLVITLGFKESTYPFGVGVGLAIILLDRKWWKIGIITIGLSLLWGLITIEFLIPGLSHGAYVYSSNMPPGVVQKVTALFDNTLKRRTMFYSFYSFGFLPIFSPAFWPLMLADFASRFLPSGFDTRWGLGLHYSAPTAVIMSVASIFSWKYLQKIKLIARYWFVIAGILILNAIFLYRVVLRGPFALAYNPAFYKATANFTFVDKLTSKIPQNATVMAQNNLAARFTHQEVYLLRDSYKDHHPDYILIDVRSGQNPNDLLGVRSVSTVIENLKKDSDYKLFYTNGQ
ncbi:MAG TPA: DUF2079 domain-containing protein, partial [Candidatus Saccharimonadales bacterium]|nr:DUF2079 domain-containing protein [Candidatus Saccharimonadales bacterium]